MPSLAKTPMAEEYVVRRAFLKTMSEKRLADFLYAVLLTRSRIRSSMGIGIYNYTRDVNCRNGCDVLLEIPEQFIQQFETMANVTLSIASVAHTS